MDHAVGSSGNSNNHNNNNNNNNNNELSIKVVILGESGVGKSSLALRFVKNEFRPYTDSTIGAAFLSKTVPLFITKGGAAANTTANTCSSFSSPMVTFKIWDTAGQEKYHSLAPLYYRGANAALVVFDLCRRSSFQTLKKWVEELRSKGPPGIAVAICGNKLDLVIDHHYQDEDQEHHQQDEQHSQSRAISTHEAQEYAESVGAAFYVETSARDDIQVKETFLKLANLCVVIPSKNGQTTSNDVNSSGRVNLAFPSMSSYSSCC
jgi:small GTP-binding protein